MSGAAEGWPAYHLDGGLDALSARFTTAQHAGSHQVTIAKGPPSCGSLGWPRMPDATCPGDALRPRRCGRLSQHLIVRESAEL